MTDLPPSQYEVTAKLYESSCTLVCRGRRLDGGEPVILKMLKPEAATEEARKRFEREHAVLKKIDMPGVVKVYGLDYFCSSLTIIFEDIGGLPLNSVMGGRFPLEKFLPISVGLAGILEGLHRLPVVHNDINPAHIVFNGESGQFRLIGFGLAGEARSRAAEEASAYISPEQTGRIKRAVDYRTDFYSLGAVFYELLTGRPPFEAEDALGMAHCHIAKTPKEPCALDPAVPAVLSEIVMKLMAKAPEDRYQSGAGLKADLERCLTSLTSGGAAPSFALGLADFPGRLQPPQKLYGREKEIARLLQAFERAAGGGCELILAAGYSGVGKTALAHEMQRAVRDGRGCFIEGKFDQLQRNAPYFGWLQAFESFVGRVLMENDADLARWKQDILSAVGNNGGVLTDVIRNLELVIGAQSSVPELRGVEAQNRFNFVFVEFVRAITANERPLVVFLDDLQWIDGASLGLLRLLLTSGVSGLLIMGAYRDNEVDAAHPLLKTVDELEASGAAVERFSLSALSKADLGAWFADCLGCVGSDCATLAGLIHGKTAGNPFFTFQTLRALEGEGLFTFDRERKKWVWDIDAVAHAGVADNVVELMSQRIQRLPRSALQILELAACLGARFEPDDLAAAAGETPEAVASALKPAVAMQLVVPSDGGWRFVHDRIQQAAYSQIPEGERAAMHWRTGKLMLRQTEPQALEGRLFDVVDHLNLGAGRFAAREEREEVVELNLRAGRKAKARAAFEAAQKYFEAGLGLLGAESWEASYGLALAIHQEAAEAAGVCGRYDRMGELAASIHQHAARFLDEVPVCVTEIRALTAQGQLLPAIRLGLSVLERLGLSLPESPSSLEVEQRLGRVLDLLLETGIDRLPALPPMTSPDHLACISVLSELGEPAYVASPQFFLVWASVMAEFSLKHGNCKLSPFAYSAYALALAATGVHVVTASNLAKASVAMLDPLGARALRCRLLNIYGCMIQPATEHIRNSLITLQEAVASTAESGDFTSGSYAAYNVCVAAFFMGEPLDRLASRFRQNMNAVASMKHDYIWNWMAFHVLAIQSLGGIRERPEELGSFDERQWLASAKASNDQCGLAYYFLSKLIVACLLDESEPGQALSHLAEEKAREAGFQATFGMRVSYFYRSLALLKYGLDQSPGALDEVRENMERLERMARLAPMNFQHKRDLIAAELARIEGNDWEAAGLYEKAAAGARANGFVQEEALACELAGAFYLGRGMETAGHLNMRRACEGYARWGAKVKAEALAARSPDWLGPRPPFRPNGAGGAENLDLTTVMKAARAISSEMELDRLLAEIMRIVIENAGAQSGVLLVQQNGAWRAAAKRRVGAPEVELPRAAVNLDEGDEASASVVRFVARTKERVVLDDAAREGKFVGDPYIRRRRTRSLLCLPLLSRGRLTGVLHLENSLTPGAFTPDKVRLVEMLVSQAATSLENARIYEALRASENKYRRLVDASNEGVWALDASGETTFVNARMAEMLGYAAEELSGCPFTGFMFTEDIPDHLKRLERRRQGISEHYERRLRHKDGRTVWTFASAAPLLDEQGGFQGAFAMFTDITGRKRTEEKLFLMNFALDKVREAAFLIDENANFCFVNEEAGRILGYARDELLGLGVASVDPDFPAERWPHHWRELKERRSLVFEGRHRAKDGCIIPVEISANYFEYDGAGYNLALVRDITERKRVEAEILQLNRDLEQRVAQRTEALERANNELESFSYSVSHDLRAPLRAIEGFSRILEEDYAGALGTDGQRCVGVVREGALQMARLIEDILAFSRMSRSEMIWEDLDMTALVRDVFDGLRDAVPERNIRFILGELPPAHGDRAMMRQVWSNLLGNAVKYSRQREEAVIEVFGVAGRYENSYCVRDNGAGFDMQYASKLFGAFQRLHSSEEFEGTGVGLSIVKRIVERHGGRVWAEAKVGEGAAFYFALPHGGEDASPDAPGGR